ncbi:snRNA-activating protein complex subunit 1b isoform X2 [Clupea harengus]|uniref:snRNA-activating protein complex subunit 1b isoform X2 n=1 Tax=Clupea harengus TaxID=7950 RepID=A0A6P8GM34_CLUHA|nr:snRNA-activating protein complex subunit 1b isoform X2 [Clupea harengus]
MGSPTSVLLSLSLKSCCNTSSYVDTATQTLFWLRLFVCSSLRVFSRQIIMSEQLRKFEEPLKTDLEELLGRFQRTTSVRYEDFSSMWRDMKFGDIFHGIQNLKEKNAFSRIALNTATAYFLPPYSFQVRVGGLYVLYGLYHSQCSLPKQKIRLALKDWGDVQAFTQDALSSQHYDVVYILHKLLGTKAFHFTAMPVPLAFLRDKKNQVMPNTEAVAKPSSRPQQLVTTEMLEEVANIHQHYKQLKASVSAQHPEASLNLVRHNLVPKLFNSVMSFSTWQNIHTGGEASVQSTSLDEPSTSSSSNQHQQQQECSRRADLLASIKARSYGQVVEVAKSRRHRQAELCSAGDAGPREDPGMGGVPGAIPRRRRRFHNSLRYRTLRRLYETGGIPEEFLTSTKLWRLSKADQEETTRAIKTRFKW